MFKNINIKLINAATKFDLGFLDERKYLVEYDRVFISRINNARPLLAVIRDICVDFNVHSFSSAIVTDAETGEVLAELKKVYEEM